MQEQDMAGSDEPAERSGRRGARWGADFQPDRLALLELRMWKAYYRRQPARLFGLLVLALREQAAISWPRAVYAAALLTKAAVGFARSTGDYDRFAPDVARGYRALGLAAGTAAGESIARLYAALYAVPLETVSEAGRLRGVAAEVRDRGATADPDAPRGEGRAYWPEVAGLLRDSYRSLSSAVRD
jgi:hypothetical protein